MTKRTAGWCGCVWVCLLALGCGSSDSGSNPKGTGGAAGAAGTGGSSDAGSDAPSGKSLDFWIGEGSYYQSSCDPTKNAPIAGASVAVDQAGAQRIELESGADGSAKLDGIDWSKGRMSFTIWAPDHSATSSLGLDEAFATAALTNGKLIFCLPPRTAPGTVNVTGKATNLVSTSNTYIASASNSVDVAVVNGTQSYGLHVWPGKAFSIFGAESLLTLTGRNVDQTLSGWTRVDHAAVSAATQIDLDFTTKLTPVKVSGKLMLPKDTASPLHTDSYGYINVVTQEGGWGAPFVGATTTSAPSAAGDAIEHQSEYLDVKDIGTIATLYSLRIQGKDQSIIWRVGPPEDGATVDGFLDVFSIASPTSAPLHDPVQFSSPDLASVGVAKVLLVFDANSELLWLAADVDPTSTQVVLPALPSKADAATVLGTLELGVRPAVAADFMPQYGGFMKQVTNGTTLKLTP